MNSPNSESSPSQSFQTVRQALHSQPRQSSKQKYHNRSAALNKSAILQSSNKQSTGQQDDMSPRFVGKENVMANANRQHTEFAILNSLPKEDLVELVINTRRQLKHYARALEEKEVRVAALKRECRDMAEELEKTTSNNQKLIEYVKSMHYQQETRHSATPSHTTSHNTSKHSHRKSTKHYSCSLQQSPTASSPQPVAPPLTELLLLTDSSTPQQLVTKVRTLKQSGKFVCSLYKLIDQHTQGKFFNKSYSLSSAWGFVKKLFKEYFDDMQCFWQSRKNNSVVSQLQQLLNCQREEMGDRVLNMMRDMARLNRVVERVKIQAGLFWVTNLQELERQLVDKSDGTGEQ